MSEDDDIDVGAWWVSQKAKETYAELRRRWDALLAWGVGDKLPNVRRQLDVWREFSAKWEAGDEDTSALSAMSADLQVAESYAREKGYAGGGPQVRPPDIEEATGLLKSAAAVDRAATAVGLPASVIGANTLPEMAQGAVRAFQGLPRAVQLGAGAAAGGLVLYGVHRLAESTRSKRRPR
ncbi:MULTISPECIES: hypothetical protein [Sorangium]|uniref:Uncharacterized protein n=1 Tax=Sorangium cellulosum TaxID=56 RepID=A0A4P2QE87_SORCE|nr:MULTISPECIES: hypothetical protein [Sorangium]AUX28140.1 uncharacterized protein SOCE836_002080 [Sorangium cellulosum]WCQ87544.1 hypothetical protein NQZ70_00207 [Sorangium sp. Soce836]